MHLVALAWIYVALMMAAAEVVHPNGSWLGAIVTFVMYGVAPMALVMYILGTPARRRALWRKEQAELAEARREADETVRTGNPAPSSDVGAERPPAINR